MKDSELLQEVHQDVKTILATLPTHALRIKWLERIVYGGTSVVLLAVLGLGLRKIGI